MTSPNLNELKKWVESRVTTKRFKHIAGVAAAGEYIARSLELGINLDDVALSCWLHDSCKELKSTELVQEAWRLGLNPSSFEQEHGHILHGPVAALTVQEKFGIENQDVLDGIFQHTLGMVPMSIFSQIIYLADALEESRPEDFTLPVWGELELDPYYKNSGKIENTSSTSATLRLAKAMLKASDLSLEHLIKNEKPIHPMAMDVRNHFLEIVKSSHL